MARAQSEAEVPRLGASETVRIGNSTNPKRQATRTLQRSDHELSEKCKIFKLTIFSTSTSELDVSVSAQLAVKLIESPVLKPQIKRKLQI
jgi:hypothetical protein